MFGLNLIEIIPILAFLVSLPLTIIGIRNHFKQKAIFIFTGFKFKEDAKDIMFWRFKISNTLSSGFVINNVFIKEQYILMFYRHKIEMNWHPDYEYHKSTNPFEKNDIIKPNTSVNIVVRNDHNNNIHIKYYPGEKLSKKVKFIFWTSLKKYSVIIPKILLVDSDQKTIQIKPIQSKPSKRKRNTGPNPITNW